MKGATPQERRALVVASGESDDVCWTASAPLQVDRVPGLMIDDAVVRNGTWLDGSKADSTLAQRCDLLVSGNLLGGRYSSYFRNLLEFGR
jgi:hypothetical protein